MRHLYILLFLIYIVETTVAGSSFPLQTEDSIANISLNEDDTTRYTHHYLRAQESCYEQYFREHNKEIFPAIDENDDSYDELKKMALARQIMYNGSAKESSKAERADQYAPSNGMFQPLLLAIDTVTGICHLLSEDGAVLAVAHLALVDSTWYLWLSVDPLADKNIANTPYMYCNGNPIKYIDPDGRDLEIAGEEKQPTFEQLQAATHLKLDMNNNGRVIRIGGVAWTKADRALNNVLRNQNVLVTLLSTAEYVTDQGKWFAGGAFAGSQIEPDGRIHALQYINPNDMVQIDMYSGRKVGVGALHEVLESYFGGLFNPGSGIPTFDVSSEEYKMYLQAHNQANACDRRHKEAPLYVDAIQGILYLLHNNVEHILHQDEIFKAK